MNNDGVIGILIGVICAMGVAMFAIGRYLYGKSKQASADAVSARSMSKQALDAAKQTDAHVQELMRKQEATAKALDDSLTQVYAVMQRIEQKSEKQSDRLDRILEKLAEKN